MQIIYYFEDLAYQLGLPLWMLPVFIGGAFTYMVIRIFGKNQTLRRIQGDLYYNNHISSDITEDGNELITGANNSGEQLAIEEAAARQMVKGEQVNIQYGISSKKQLSDAEKKERRDKKRIKNAEHDPKQRKPKKK